MSTQHAGRSSCFSHLFTETGSGGLRAPCRNNARAPVHPGLLTPSILRETEPPTDLCGGLHSGPIAAPIQQGHQIRILPLEFYLSLKILNFGEYEFRSARRAQD